MHTFIIDEINHYLIYSVVYAQKSIIHISITIQIIIEFQNGMWLVVIITRLFRIIFRSQVINKK